MRRHYAVHRSPSRALSREDRIERTKAMLARAFNLRTVVAVIGSGLSQPLGYPSWHVFTSDLVQFTLGQIPCGRSEHARLRDFLARLKQSNRPDCWELVFFLGCCQRLLSKCPGADASTYFKKLKDVFKHDDKPGDIPNNPYDALAKLPIDRYVTTNYDCEIERALARKHGLSLTAFGIPYPTHESSDQTSYFLDPGKYLSFTQTPESREQLALFALARLPEPSDRVFHCHGRFDDPRSMVVTEADYQKWYLSDGADINSTFFQSLDLLFSANPILFLGYSLRDDDLLRPLRIISATESYRKSTRPLFALLPERSDSDWDHHEFLFERYGIHVIPFPEPRDSTPNAWANTYSTEFHQLRDNWEQRRQGWLEKPYFRKVELPIARPEPYHHYAIGLPEDKLLGRSKVEKNCQQLVDNTQGRFDRDGSQPRPEGGEQDKPPPRKGCVIVIVGPGGTGKSLHAVRLMDVLQKDRKTYRYAGYFFWSSYYADDYVTGLDRFLNYSEQQQPPLQTSSRLERLRTCLKGNRYLIVIDGFERMLRQSEVPDEGDAYHPTIKKLLEILSDKDNQSTVVLTSRLWPKNLGDPDDAKAIIRYTLEPMVTDDIRYDSPFKDLERKHRSALCSLLNGNVYALLLAARTISAPSGTPAPDLIKALADTPPDRRISRMIREVVAFRRRGEHGDLAVEVLKRIAIFMTPIPSITQDLCFQEAKKALRLDSGFPPDINTVLATLVSLCLVFRIDHRGSDVTVHPMVRSYLFHPHRSVGLAALPNFSLSGFTSGNPPLDPGSSDSVTMMSDLFTSMDIKANELLAKDPRNATSLCRGLFGIVRSRMEANTAPRWTTYGEYLLFPLRVLDLATTLSSAQGRVWDYRERHEIAEIEDPEAPLYADELAFLYNDIGLAYCAEGSILDTAAVWEQGYEVNRIIEGAALVPQYTLQSQLHLAHTFIDVGRLSIAEHYLRECERTNHSVKDKDYEGRILGYRAVIAYLRGHLQGAARLYAKALGILKSKNHRAESFFYGWRVALEISRKDLDKAERYGIACRALAEVGDYPDLVAIARMRWGSLLRARGAVDKATSEWNRALEEASRFGMRRLEAELLARLSRVALQLGDYTVAKQRAFQALKITNELGLGLVRTYSLIALGLAMLRSREQELGMSYLRLAKIHADHQEYRLRLPEIDEELEKVGGQAGLRIAEGR